MTEIKLIRIALGLSVEQMALELCVAPRTLQRWESGVRHCPPGVIKMARILLEQKGKPQ